MCPRPERRSASRPGALPAVIGAFRETMELADSYSGAYDSGDAPLSALEPEAIPMQPASVAAARPAAPLPPAAPAAGTPYRVSFTPSGGIEVVGRIETETDLEDLMHVLTAQKTLFKLLAKKTSEIERPETSSTTQS